MTSLTLYPFVGKVFDFNEYIFPSMLIQIISPKPVLFVFQFLWNKGKKKRPKAQCTPLISLEEYALWLSRVPNHTPPLCSTPNKCCQQHSTTELSTQDLEGPVLVLKMTK